MKKKFISYLLIVSSTIITIFVITALGFVTAQTQTPPNGNPTFPAGPQGPIGPQGPQGLSNWEGPRGTTGMAGKNVSITDKPVQTIAFECNGNCQTNLSSNQPNRLCSNYLNNYRALAYSCEFGYARSSGNTATMDDVNYCNDGIGYDMLVHCYQ